MQNIKILGIPFDFGQVEIGVRMAADFFKEDGLIERLKKIAPLKNLGHLNFPFKEPPKVPDRMIKHSANASSCCEQISKVMENEILDDSFILNIGGDHGMSLGTIHGLLARDPDTIVVWADAFGKINTPQTSLSGDFHEMPLAFLLQYASHEDFQWMKFFMRPEKIIVIGPNLDPSKEVMIKSLGVQYYSLDDLNRIGVKEILEMAFHRADLNGVCPVHLSLDVNLFKDRGLKPNPVTTSVGARLEELFLIGGLLGGSGRLKSMDIVGFNPLIGSEHDVMTSSELIQNFITATIEQAFQEVKNSSHLSKNFLRHAFTDNLFQREK